MGGNKHILSSINIRVLDIEICKRNTIARNGTIKSWRSLFDRSVLTYVPTPAIISVSVISDSYVRTYIRLYSLLTYVLHASPLRILSVSRQVFLFYPSYITELFRQRVVTTTSSFISLGTPSFTFIPRCSIFLSSAFPIFRRSTVACLAIAGFDTRVVRTYYAYICISLVALKLYGLLTHFSLNFQPIGWWRADRVFKADEGNASGLNHNRPIKSTCFETKKRYMQRTYPV